MINTIANVTNVVFGDEDDVPANGSDQSRVRKITGTNVREILRGNVQEMRPSFGPILYPMFQARKKELEAELELPSSIVRRRKPRRSISATN
jgi:hypothetical protein